MRSVAVSQSFGQPAAPGAPAEKLQLLENYLPGFCSARIYSEDVPFEFVYFRFAISFLPCVHRIASLADAVNVAAFFLTNSCTLIGPCPVSVSTLSDSRS